MGREVMVRPERFELPTYCSGGNRSIHLSYGRSTVNYMTVYMRQVQIHSFSEATWGALIQLCSLPANHDLRAHRIPSQINIF